MNDHGKHSSVKVKVQLGGNGRARLKTELGSNRSKKKLKKKKLPSTADTYVFLLPLAEVDLEGRHGELLAHTPLVVNRFRDQRGILRAVTAGRRLDSKGRKGLLVHF